MIEFERVESREVGPAAGQGVLATILELTLTAGELAGFYGFVSTGFVGTPLLT